VTGAFFTTKNTNGHEKISWKIRLVLTEKAISMKFFRTTIPKLLVFQQDFSGKKAPSHWHISTSPSDCGAFTRHCRWVGFSPQTEVWG
jgi:hypothetical protein